jgi:hypothetical protein
MASTLHGVGDLRGHTEWPLAFRNPFSGTVGPWVVCTLRIHHVGPAVYTLALLFLASFSNHSLLTANFFVSSYPSTWTPLQRAAGPRFAAVIFLSSKYPL